MSPQDDGYNDWSAVEKGPSPTVMVGGGAAAPDHAGAALRALGSIWLVTLMFVFIVLAALSVGSWAFYKLNLNSDAVENARLQEVQNLIDYKESLDSWSTAMTKDRMLALREPKAPGLWNDIARERTDNEKQRAANKQATEAAKQRTNPREPQCLDPIRRCR